VRDNRLSNHVFKSYDDILDHRSFAWNKLIDMPWKIILPRFRRGCSRPYDHTGRGFAVTSAAIRHCSAKHIELLISDDAATFVSLFAPTSATDASRTALKATRLPRARAC